MGVVTSSMRSPNRPTARAASTVATDVGTVLVAGPLAAGLVAASMTLGGRFGGPSNALTAFWYVATAAAPVALVGAAVLLVAHRRDEHRSRLLTWSMVAAGGWLFGMGSAQVTGLADGPESAQQPWQLALLGLGVAVYLIGLVGLVVSGRRARA